MGSAANIELIKQVYAAFGRGDVEFILGCLTDDVDWASEASSAGAPWYGVRHGREGVLAFFEQLAKAVEVEEFTPLTFAANDDDVLTVVAYASRSRETGKLASMQIHHWFHFRDGKIAKYRGSEDTALTVATLQP